MTCIPQVVPQRGFLLRYHPQGHGLPDQHREEPDFFKKLEFMSFFAPFLPYGKVIVTPDLDLLGKCWGRANTYLHAPKRAETTWTKPEWWIALLETLEGSTQHLVEIHSGLMGHIDLSPHGDELYRELCTGQLSPEEVKHQLEESFRVSPPRKVERTR